MRVAALLCLIFVFDSLQKECSICNKADREKVESLLNNGTELMEQQQNYLNRYMEKLQNHFEKNNTGVIKSFLDDIADKFYFKADVEKSMFIDCYTKFKENVVNKFTPARSICRILTLQIVADVLVETENNIRQINDYIANIKRDVCREDLKPPACVPTIPPDLLEPYEKIWKRVAHTRKMSNRIAQIAVEMNNSCLWIRIIETQMQDGSIDSEVEKCAKKIQSSDK